MSDAEIKPTKILVCMLSWKGDQKLAENVVRLGCDLLAEPTEQAEMAFISRYDSPPPSAAVQYQAGIKFSKVHVWKCNRRAEGFPGGCNEMAYGLLNWVLVQRHMNAGFQDIDAILILEGDCVITRRTWVEELCQVWDEAKKLDKLVVGTLQAGRPEWNTNDHINAVALYDREIVRKLPCLQGGPMHIGWDNYHGPKMVPVAVNSELFKLDYRRPTITASELFTEPTFPLIYHGVKDGSAIACVRDRYKI